MTREERRLIAGAMLGAIRVNDFLRHANGSG